MKQKHSPLPWRQDEFRRVLDAEGFLVAEAQKANGMTRKYDQKFIVRACNNYDEMRDLVESVTTIYGANDTRCTIDAAKELLAKLEAADAE